jgi:hypothetical protein
MLLGVLFPHISMRAGWEGAESRCAADTAAEASCRSHASGAGNGGGLDGGVAGVLGTAATWVASTDNRAAGRQTPRLVGAGEGQKLRCLACIVTMFEKERSADRHSPV